nr:reverse transcriptase domain-containing protein [Tanacetum cinerariifolium]
MVGFENTAVNTRSGLAYEGPPIPTNSPLEKVVEQNTEETTKKEHSNCQGSTAQVQPPIVPISILEPDVPRTQPKPTIPYPSRLNDQKLREKATNQMEKFFQIFHDLHFDISFADALLLMPKFASTIKSQLPVPKELSKTYLSRIVQDNTKSSNPTLVFESECCKKPIVKSSSSPTLTPFRESDFFLEEIEDFLNDESIPTGIENSFYDLERDILYLENLLNEDPFKFPLMNLKQGKSHIEEPEYSLSMGYEHLSTTLETKSDEVTKSSAKNLLPIPSEYEVTSDDESECDVPIKDDSSVFTTFSNPLFNDNDEFTSSDDESLPDEDVPIEEFKVYLNPLFDSNESNFFESLFNHDALIDSSLKFDYLEEFSGALMPTSIADEERIMREHEEYISLMERLLTINPCPLSMEKFHANTIFETLPTSHILVQDSDSQREEIDIFTSTDNLLPSSIESDYDLDREIYVLEELLVDNSIPCSENELYDFDHDNPSFLRPPPERPDVEFDLEPNLGEVISEVMNNINEDECFDPGEEIDVFANDEDDDYFPFIFFIRIFLPYLIYPEVSPLLLFAGNEDTIFNPGISI